MILFVVHNALGEILRSGSCPASMLSIQAEEGQFVVEGVADDTQYYVADGQIVDFPEKPSDYHVWDWTTHAWRLSDTAAADQAAVELADRKRLRQEEVDAILVTTQAGNVFDGDEVSQGRMARAILGMQTQPGITINWVLANNLPTPVNAAELTEALALAGLSQAAIWSRPYE